MAIAYTAAGNNNAGTGNSSQVNVAATGSDRKAIIFVWGEMSGATPSVTVDGTSTGVNQIGSRLVLSGTQDMYAYYFDNPSTSSVEYRVTEAGSYPEIHVLMYSGCATGAVDSNASKTGDTALDLTTTVVASNCWLVSIGRDYSDGDLVVSTGTTQRNNGAGCKSGDSNGTVGTGSQTMNWSNNGSGSTGGFIVSIAPVASASGPANLKSLDTNLKANIKSYNTNLIANIKSINTNV